MIKFVIKHLFIQAHGEVVTLSLSQEHRSELFIYSFVIKHSLNAKSAFIAVTALSLRVPEMPIYYL